VAFAASETRIADSMDYLTAEDLRITLKAETNENGISMWQHGPHFYRNLCAKNVIRNGSEGNSAKI